jgi:hypothetical protein
MPLGSYGHDMQRKEHYTLWPAARCLLFAIALSLTGITLSSGSRQGDEIAVHVPLMVEGAVAHV